MLARMNNYTKEHIYIYIYVFSMIYNIIFAHSIILYTTKKYNNPDLIMTNRLLSLSICFFVKSHMIIKYILIFYEL